MAVPKRKTTKSKRNMRRSHDSLKLVNLAIDKTSGEYKLPHHIELKTGYYNGRHTIIKRQKNTSENEE